MKGTDLFGYSVMDKITGFSGRVVAYCQYLSGCNQMLVVPCVTDDGGYREGQWFDEQRLMLRPALDRIVLDNGANPGCDAPAPKY
jgi:hypothetical protein